MDSARPAVTVNGSPSGHHDDERIHGSWVDVVAALTVEAGLMVSLGFLASRAWKSHKAGTAASLRSAIPWPRVAGLAAAFGLHTVFLRPRAAAVLDRAADAWIRRGQEWQEAQEIRDETGS